MTAPFLVCAIVTAISAFVSLGFSIASVPRANGQIRTLALYTCARSIAFAIISVVPFATGWSLWLIFYSFALHARRKQLILLA